LRQIIADIAQGIVDAGIAAIDARLSQAQVNKINERARAG